MQTLIMEPWRLRTEGFCMEKQGQLESLFCQGNGFLGIRYASELPSYGRKRDCFVAGVYDAASGEVSELVNFPDPLALSMSLDGEEMTMAACTVYEAELDLRTGRACRRYRLVARNGKTLDVYAERVVSLAQQHLVAERLTFQTDMPCELRWQAVIDGQTTNAGTQHFLDGVRQCVPEKGWRMNCQTVQSGISATIAVSITSQAKVNHIVRRRRVIGTAFEANGNEPETFTRYAVIHTSRETAHWEQEAEREAQSAAEQGFDLLCGENAAAWSEYWSKADITIDSDEPMDQTAIRFALYHLRVMTPLTDARASIGAKGLSGEAYKGHVFWDTEMFLLPAWLVIDPETAERLLQYRYACLPAARDKAGENGYRGAQFAWESANPDDGDVTPETIEGWIDPATGMAIPILERTDEIHITADIAYGVWQTWQATGDESFMAAFGDDLLRETALFWASRAVWNETKKRYEILNVIGPDEYSEHSDNNAYTNWMAHWNMDIALRRKLFSSGDETFVRGVACGLYLPCPDARGVIPQADGWLSLKQVDVASLRGLSEATLLNVDVTQLACSQVSKQADVVALLTTLGDVFPPDACASSFDYYEARCLHHSSLSYATHCLALAQMGQTERAYAFFSKVRALDLIGGTSSADGIHAAALGGIWQCVVKGFAGLCWVDGKPVLHPKLPHAWKRVSIPLGTEHRRVTITSNDVTFE